MAEEIQGESPEEMEETEDADVEGHAFELGRESQPIDLDREGLETPRPNEL